MTWKFSLRKGNEGQAQEARCARSALPAPLPASPAPASAPALRWITLKAIHDSQARRCRAPASPTRVPRGAGDDAPPSPPLPQQLDPHHQVQRLQLLPQGQGVLGARAGGIWALLRSPAVVRTCQRSAVPAPTMPLAPAPRSVCTSSSAALPTSTSSSWPSSPSLPCPP